MSMAPSIDTQEPAQHIADSHDLLRVEGASHFLVEDAPDEVGADLAAFLVRQE